MKKIDPNGVHTAQDITRDAKAKMNGEGLQMMIMMMMKQRKCNKDFYYMYFFFYFSYYTNSLGFPYNYLLTEIRGTYLTICEVSNPNHF